MEEQRNRKLIVGSSVEDLTYIDLRSLLIADYEIQGYKSLLTAKDRKTRYLSSLKHLDNFFGAKAGRPAKKALTITGVTVESFKMTRHEEGGSNVSINRSLQLLRRMFSLAVEKAEFPGDRVPSIKKLAEPPPRSGFLELEDFVRLRQALPEYLRVPTTLAFYSGMRMSEVMNLRWEYVKLKREMICMPAGYTKNNDPRDIPINGTPLPEMLKILREQNPTADFVFTRNGLMLHSIRKAWNRACITTGLGSKNPVIDVSGAPMLDKKGKPRMKYDGLIFHDLRRSAITNMVHAGVDPFTATEISGHRTQSVFRRYKIKVERNLKAQMAKVGAHLDSIVKRTVKVEGSEGTSQVGHFSTS
jgi:integrase